MRFRAAVELVEQRDQPAGIFRSKAVVDGLGFTAGCDDAEIAQAGQMLRQRRLAKADRFGQCSHRHFLIDEAAQDHQALGLAQGGQQAGGFIGARLARRLPAAWVRTGVVLTGLAMTAAFLMRG